MKNRGIQRGSEDVVAGKVQQSQDRVDEVDPPLHVLR